MDVVLAQERDRISREPAYYYLLRQQLESHGTALKALNDSDDESPLGAFQDGVLDQVAKLQRAMFAQKSRQNKLKKAREGKLIGSGSPPYGFRYNPDRTNYEVDGTTMPVVRRLFRMVGAEGWPLHAAIKTFEAEGIKPPGGGPHWLVTSMRRTVDNDVYRPHDYDEIASLVDDAVAARLDPAKLYGIAWYGQNRVTITPDGEKRRRFRKNPRSEWIAVPVPDAGIPSEHVDGARAALAHQPQRSKPGSSFWELGGLGYCGACGSRLTPYATGRDHYARKYAYYTCMKRRKHGNAACPDGATCRSAELEETVMTWVDDLLDDPRRIAAHVDQAIERETAALRDPDTQARAWADQITACDRKRAAYQDQQAAGLMTLDELGARLKVLADDRAAAEHELDRLKGGQRRIKQLQAQKRFILETFGKGIKLGLIWFPAHMRRAIYQMLQLKITVQDNHVHVEADVNANVIQLTKDVEEYAQRLNEAAWRIEAKQEGEDMTTREAIDMIETELRKVRDSVSQTKTDTVMAEVVS